MTRPLLVLLACMAALVLASPAGARAQGSPWWQIGSEVSPTNLPPGETGVIRITLSDLGAGEVNGEASPVSVTDTLPSGLTAVSASGGSRRPTVPPRPPVSCTPLPATVITCTYKARLNSYEQLGIAIKVNVEESPGTVTALPNRVSVEGGGATGASSAIQELTINGARTPFGVQSYELEPFSEQGAAVTQAGAHPFQLTTGLALNQVGMPIPTPVALAKDVRVTLPPGLVGNPTAVAHCAMVDFAAIVEETNLCPPSSVVGVATVTAYEPLSGLLTKTVPVFNVEPGYGEPARLGFEVFGLVEVVIDTSVLNDEGYEVQASVNDITEAAALLSSQVTLWGVPGAQTHDNARGWECVAGGEYRKQIEGEPSCPGTSVESEVPFLTLPTSCPVEGSLDSRAEVSSWAQPLTPVRLPYIWSGPLQEPLELSGCGALPFAPVLQALPGTSEASSPTGLDVSVRMPDSGLVDPQGSAEADLENTAVTLPEGVQLNPSAANGRLACTEAQVGYERTSPDTGMQHFATGASSCPEASKVGVVHIKTPLLSGELEGALYLAQPAPNAEPGQNPFDSLVALYLVAEDKQAGVLVKLAGKGELNESTGQITTSFPETPQLPFEELKLETFGGQRASVSTPARCGSYRASTVFDAWSGAVAEPASAPFEITSGAGGGPCPSGPLAFSPSFVAQSANTQAGAFTPFELEIARPDGQQALSGVTVSLPPGIAALLSQVTPCQEPPPGVEWDCGEGSKIGRSTAESGLGSEPVSLPGEVFLTTGYDGAPFGLLVRTRAKAGPFDLGYVNVRSRINVNPETAAVTITTDPGPHGDALITMLKGIPVQLKRLLVTVDRPDFEFNPTSCEPMSIQGSLSGSEGATAGVSSRFQVGGCQNLPFHPTLTATVGGHASKADGTGFDVKIASQGLGVANIRKVELQIPAQLPSRQSTLNQACLATTFQANPASCPEGSVIGYATVHTPVLKSALSGPAYLVSYGNAKFPDVEFVLQGEGVTLVLDGHTDIKNGVTYSKFETAPDAPFTSFETSLPAGPHGILTAYASEKEPYELCGTKLSMPTTIVAQDGATIQQNTSVTPTGCNGVLAKKTTKPTRAQQLAKALAACRKRYRHSKPRRTACEKTARKRYAPVKKKNAHKAKKATRRRG